MSLRKQPTSPPKLLWVTRDQREIALLDMETTHIKNTIKMIEDGRMNKHRICSGLGMQDWRTLFYQELRRREALERLEAALPR